MDIIQFTEGLNATLKERVNRSTRQGTPGELLTFVQELLYELQQFTYNYKFKSTEEEIKFFKEAKPTLLSQFYYYRKVTTITLFTSYKDEEQKKFYYQGQLQKLEEFARKHAEFYLYCVTGLTYLDNKYFVRHRTATRKIIDLRFSTGYDDTFARLLANELLKEYLQAYFKKSSKGMLTWNASKTDMVELIYALHAANAINGDNMEIKQIASLFEDIFQVDLGNYYDVMKKIRTRKQGQSNFLDRLKLVFLKRLDDLEK
jgi:hypothetical protein